MLRMLTRTKITLSIKGNPLANETSFHFMNVVSNSTTTTSSVVKPLGAGFYWKPVALTKNTTVVMYVARVAAVTCAQYEIMIHSVASAEELSH